MQTGKQRAIAFASKSRNHAQSKCPTHQLEFFAMKWLFAINSVIGFGATSALCVWTDNNPLKYILTKPKLEQCWVAKLAPFDFDIQYIPGPQNVVTDELSRKPFGRPRMLHRLTRNLYADLLREAENLQVDSVRDMFCLSTELSELRAMRDASMSGDVRP